RWKPVHSSRRGPGLRLKELSPGGAGMGAGETRTVSYHVTSAGPSPESAVAARGGPPPPLSYVNGSTAVNGGPLPDDEDGSGPIFSGVNLGILQPKAAATVTYRARAASPVPSVRALAVRGTVSSAEDPAATNANGPR